MTSPLRHRELRAQLKRDFTPVCDYFGFDAAYRKQIKGWLDSARAAKIYRAIANSLT